jgi:hypothetical protein
MRNRFSDAVAIQQGACNPHGVARSLLAALDECRAYGVQPETDDACRAICHQLTHILNVRAFDSDYFQAMKRLEGAAEVRHA